LSCGSPIVTHLTQLLVTIRTSSSRSPPQGWITMFIAGLPPFEAAGIAVAVYVNLSTGTLKLCIGSIELPPQLG
jgi:hypothetical protein